MNNGKKKGSGLRPFSWSQRFARVTNKNQVTIQNFGFGNTNTVILNNKNIALIEGQQAEVLSEDEEDEDVGG